MNIQFERTKMVVEKFGVEYDIAGYTLGVFGHGTSFRQRLGMAWG